MWQFTIITVYVLAFLWAGVKIREVTPRTIKNHRKYYKTAAGVLCVGLIGFIFTMNSNYSGVNDTYTIGIFVIGLLFGIMAHICIAFLLVSGIFELSGWFKHRKEGRRGAI
ncbi:hypothetical protein PV433_10685 [Paenibacillus sp. GYB004]|uniref:hypothetical protein n=1 Tax=Paenibacillus sp. GYB004 TaxID=2994393 RepID=UPI002F969925